MNIYGRLRMDKNKVLKYGGIVAVVIGAGALNMSGTGEAAVVAIVGGVFVLAGVIAAILKS
jgi:hypothetical protein